MEPYQIVLDGLMCVLWITTYTLCFISTIKFHHLALSPITQLMIAPFEFAVLYGLISKGTFSLNYVSIAYLYWAFIEIALCVLVIKYAFQSNRKKTVVFILALAVMTVLMIYLVTVKKYKFFFSYFNTFIGELFWFYYILKDDYPIKPLNLAAFIAKFVGDAISIPVYLFTGNIVSSVVCVLLPILDFCFVYVYFVRSLKNRRAEKKKKH